MSSASPANLPERAPSHTETVAISDGVSKQLDKILQSATFQGCESLKRFLRYAVEYTLRGEGSQLKEYRLGVEVFQRSATFDPRLDPVVRMAARRLRSKLGQYYDGEGHTDPVRIDVPKGSYSATFTPHISKEAPTGPVLILTAKTHSQKNGGHLTMEAASSPAAADHKPSADDAVQKVSFRWLWAGTATLALLAALFVLGRQAFVSTSGSTTSTVGAGKLLIADVVNSTGERVFDDALKQAIAVDMSQSPLVDIISEAKIQSTLKLMSRPVDTRITPEVAREVCQRSGSTTYVASSIQSLGQQYVIGLNAVNCQTGDMLGQEQSTAADKEHVLKAMDEASRKLRQKLGESFNTIQKFDVPLEQATTPSLEALKAYWLGNSARDRRGDAAAVPFFTHAVELDPDFAMAYDALGISYSNLDEPGRASENIAKAYAKRDRASERERFEIAADYSQMVTGELDKVNAICEEWAQMYPRDEYPHDLLGLNYEFVGKYENAILETSEAIRLNPDGVVLRSNLMEAQIALDRLDDAKITYRDALARNLDHPYLHADRYGIAFLEGDSPEMDRQVSWASGQPGGEDLLLSLQSNSSAFLGMLSKARDYSRRAVESAMRSGQKETAALWKMNGALQEAEFGNFERAREQTAAALKLAATRDVRILAGLTLARANDPSTARRIADVLEAQFPLNLVLNRYWLPTIRAAIELDRSHPQKAIDILTVAATHELGYPNPQIGVGGLRYPAYLRGEAFLRLKNGSAAVAEFRKISGKRSQVGNSPLGAVALLSLARAYALTGDTSQSRDLYRQFLSSWKDADSDIPLLRQARAEYKERPRTLH